MGIAPEKETRHLLKVKQDFEVLELQRKKGVKVYRELKLKQQSAKPGTDD